MAHWADPLKDWGDVLVKQGTPKMRCDARLERPRAAKRVLVSAGRTAKVLARAGAESSCGFCTCT
jgi:hypothetical protein